MTPRRLSLPCVPPRYLLKVFGLTKSPLYQLCMKAFVALFFVVRVVLLPLYVRHLWVNMPTVWRVMQVPGQVLVHAVGGLVWVRFVCTHRLSPRSRRPHPTPPRPTLIPQLGLTSLCGLQWYWFSKVSRGPCVSWSVSACTNPCPLPPPPNPDPPTAALQIYRKFMNELRE
jgi:hypothetical protein